MTEHLVIELHVARPIRPRLRLQWPWRWQRTSTLIHQRVAPNTTLQHDLPEGRRIIDSTYAYKSFYVGSTAERIVD